METLILDYNNDSTTLDKAVDALKSGNIGIFPTDTVNGIGCDALNINAITNLFKFKKRSFDKPINILVSNIDMVKKLVKNINPIEQKLIENFWPGSLTIIFDKSDIIPDILTSNLHTVGIRMPNSKICLDLINSFEGPIATSSANIASDKPYESTDEMLKHFDTKISFILKNTENNTNIPSTIIRVENNEILILRKGSISKEDIEKCFGGNINVR